jgi:hypothetical protein
LGESRLVDAELDAGTKLDATEVAGTELIGDVDLGGVELAAARRAQQRGVHVDSTELVGGVELSGVFEGSEEACELRRGARKPMGWSVWNWMEVTQRHGS